MMDVNKSTQQNCNLSKVKTALLILILGYSMVGRSQQSIKWVCPPLTFTVDRLYTNNDKNLGADIFIFKIGEFYGVVDAKSKIISPAVNVIAHIEENGKIYNLIDGKQAIYHDRDGNKYNFDQFRVKFPYPEKTSAQVRFDNLNLPVKCLPISKKGWIKIEMANGQIVDSMYQDWDFKSYAPKSFKIGNKTYFYETGKVFVEKDKFINELTDKYLIVRENKLNSKLLDFNLNSVFPTLKSNIYFTKNSKYIVTEESALNKISIYNQNVELQTEGEFGFVYDYPPYLYFEKKGGNIQSFNMHSKVTLDLPYNKFNHINNTHFAKVTKDSINELLNLTTGQIVIKPEMKQIYQVGNFYVANNTTRAKRAGPFFSKIYNHKFEKIKEADIFEYINKGVYLFVKLGENKSIVLDSTGNIVKEGSFWPANGNFISLNYNGKYWTTPLENFVGSNDKKLYFTSVNEEANTAISKKNIYIAELDGVYGVINSSGQILVPFKFQEISFGDRSGHQCVAKYNSNLGILDISNL